MLVAVQSTERIFTLVLDANTARVISSCARIHDLNDAGAVGRVNTDFAPINLSFLVIHKLELSREKLPQVCRFLTCHFCLGWFECSAILSL